MVEHVLISLTDCVRNNFVTYRTTVNEEILEVWLTARERG